MKVNPIARKRWLPAATLTAAVLAWGVTAALLSEAKLHNLHSAWAYDLAFFHNLLWNTIHGSWFTQTSSPHEASGLFQLHHTYPILLVVAPIYALIPKVTTLLWIQCLAVASAALPVARLARAGGATPWATVAIALAFLLQVPLWMTALCDFRPIVLGIPLLLWTLAMVHEDRPLAALILGAVTLTVREEMIYLTIVLSLALPFARRAGPSRRFVGGVLCAMAVLYWFAIRAAGGELTYYFDPRDASPSGSLALQALETGELRHLLPYLLPFGAAGVLAAPLLAPALPLLVFLLLVSPHEWADWAGVYGHHAAPLLPVLGGAAAVGWGVLYARTLRWKRRVLIATLLLVHLGCAAWLGPPLLRANVSPRAGLDAATVDAVHALCEEVPPDASVAADYHTMALFSGRERQICTADFTMGEADRFSWSPDWFPPGFEDVDWVIFDAEQDRALALAAADCPAFERVDAAGPFVLYGRVSPGGEDCTDKLRVAPAEEPGAPESAVDQGAVGEQESANSSGQ